jgi:hypothetical protein
MALYSKYIELSARYESVVDLTVDERDPDLWHNYIVHDDMKNLMKHVCDSLKNEEPDQRRSFWIHGTYGTGKSYAAIVLKHLFEDRLDGIERFLSQQILAPFKKKFLDIRKNGDFLVVWKNGVTDVKSGTHLLMEAEMAIRTHLKAKFGDNAYYGTGSLVSIAQKATEDNSYNWQNIFESSVLSDEYSTFEEVKDSLNDGNEGEKLKICEQISRIFRDKGWGFLSVVDTFEAWVKDIIAGNNLAEGGIILIWDEFTQYLRDVGDDNVLQRLSRLCKEDNAPFFMFLIVHIDPAGLESIGFDKSKYEKILGRYHELEFHITEDAAYDLIGGSIIPKAGMEKQWEDEKKKKVAELADYSHEFDNLSLNGKSITDRLISLAPIHPMTLTLLAVVAQNFGASQRTLFRFMKDPDKKSENVGFIHYIENHEPDEWGWLTPNFLWDYFFTRESDVKGFPSEAKKVFQHYERTKDKISDEYAKHVLKAAMLLIAIMSSSTTSSLYSGRAGKNQKISSNRSALYRCFYGQLSKEQVDDYLNAFDSNDWLRFSPQGNGDARLELPYAEAADKFEVRLEKLEKDNSRYMLFKKNGVFSKSIESKIWDSNRATNGRIAVVACCNEKTSIVARLGELKAELDRYEYKIGLFVIVISYVKHYVPLQSTVKELSEEDTTGRIAFCLIKTELTDTQLERWYTAKTHEELSDEDGKVADKNRYEEEALTIVESWANEAKDGQIIVHFKGTPYTGMIGVYDLHKRVENDILFKIYPYAPEQLNIPNTAFKRNTVSAVENGLDRSKKINAPVSYVSDSIRNCGLYDIEKIDELVAKSGNVAATTVIELAKFISERLSQGAKVSLDRLWLDLQKPPYGYSNTIAAGYLLGFMLRYYVDGSFTWIDPANPHPPSVDNFKSMILKMMNGETTNHYLSSGTEAWQNFKGYVQKIFKLNNQEAATEESARKYVSAVITKIGVPLWAVEFLPADELGGIDAQNNAVEITRLFGDFVAERGNQEDVMSNVIQRFGGAGKLRQILSDKYFDTLAMRKAFWAYIADKSPEIAELCGKLSLTDNDLYDAIKVLMQGQVSTWIQTQVEEKLAELTLELQVTFVLSSATGIPAKNLQSAIEPLSNKFDVMHVPGSIIERLPFNWVPTLKLIRSLTKMPWNEIKKRADIVAELSANSKTVWEYLADSRLLLVAYLKHRNVQCTDKEANGIYSKLKPHSYEYASTAFDNDIDRLIEGISYNRNVEKAKTLWVNKTGTQNVTEWCKKYFAPISWVLSARQFDIVRIIKDIQDGRKVEPTALTTALREFDNGDFSVLQNASAVRDAFFSQIGESYKTAWGSDEQLLRGRLMTNGKLTSDIYSWGAANKVAEIRKVFDVYLKETQVKKAKERVREMSEAELRNRVLALLDNSPEQYEIFLK